MIHSHRQLSNQQGLFKEFVCLTIVFREGMQLGYAKIFSARYASGGEHNFFCIPLKTDTHNPINYASRS